MQAEQPLTVPLLLDALVNDKRLDVKHMAQCLSAIQSSATVPVAHPLIAIAEQSLPDKQRTGGCLTIDVLLHWLAQRYDQRVFTIDPLVIDVSAVTAVMSAQFAKRHRILAVQVSDDEVVIAHCEPLVSDWEKHLQSVLCHPIRRVLANPVELDRFITEFYHLATSVHGAIAHHPNQAASIANLEQMVELGKLETPDANDQPIIRIVDGLLNYAFAQRASDIHIEPRRAATYIRFRIDGALHTVYQLPVPVGIAVVSRLKILGRLNVAEKRRPQDGRLKTKTSPGHGAPGQEIELRLATLPTAFGEKIVLRIFDPEVLLRRFEQLGLEGEDYQRWQSMIERSHGIVLVTGPTGSGKTTTLYSSLKHLAVPTVNVCTIEDPIEMMEDSFNQMQVQHSIGLDFASGVRALMRQDPDIIMIGEIRDLETAEMAIQAALTGHLVLSTLHTNDAPAAITRLLELGGAPLFVARHIDWSDGSTSGTHFVPAMQTADQT